MNIFPKEYIESLAGDLVKTLDHITHSPELAVTSLFTLLSREDEAQRQQFIKTISDVSEDF